MNDETSLRRDLEVYMQNSMKNKIPRVQNITLEPAHVSFGRGLRALQQATLLGYQGFAILDATGLSNSELPTTEEIRKAQIDTLEQSAGGGLQYYLTSSSSQPVTVLQVQVSNFTPISFETTKTAAPEQAPTSKPLIKKEKGKKTGMIIGIVVAVVFIVTAMAGFFVWRELRKPPPPPPFKFDHNEEDMDVDDIVEINKTLKVAITESTSGSDGMTSPKSPSPANSNEKIESVEGMEVVPLSKKSKKGVIDLRKPAKHAKGIESVIQEHQAPASAKSADADSSFDDGILEVCSIASNADESMAGFSLATDGPEPEASAKKPMTPKRLLDSISKRTNGRASPELQNKAQMRWFHNERKVSSHRLAVLSSSKQQANLTLEKVSDPLRDSMTGADKDTEVFVDDDEDGVEVVSRTSEECPSSYKEDDSVRSGSVMSGLSSADGDAAFASPGPTKGALGYFYRELEEEFQEDFYVTPQRNTVRTSHALDDLSDVPSDERHDNRKSEQDLSGFSKIQTLEKELDGITGLRSPDGRPSVVTPPEGFWEENSEMVEAMVRERRRIKRQSRNRRKERKQPPLSMEI